MQEEINFEEQNEEKYEFIIENGFFIYTLIKLYISYKGIEENFQEDEEDETNAILNQFK